MKTGTKRHAAIVAALAALLQCIPHHANAQAGAADPWRFSIVPYLWLPSMDGTLRYSLPPAAGSSANVSIDADTLLGALDAALMIAGEARRGRWSIATDVIYLDLSSDQSAVESVDFNTGSGPVNVATTALNSGTETRVTGTVWTLVGGYALMREPQPTLDLIGGVRYFDLEAKTDWRLSATVSSPGGAQTFTAAGTLTRSDELWDAIVGIRGRIRVGDSRWFAPYYLDIGGGSSNLTWQGMLGAGYAFKWCDVLLSYRYLYYSQSGGDKLIEELKFGGLGLGVGFRF